MVDLSGTFCPHSGVEELVDHLRTCKECREGVSKLWKAYPLLGMFLSSPEKLFTMLDNLKGPDHGKRKETE